MAGARWSGALMYGVLFLVVGVLSVSSTPSSGDIADISEFMTLDDDTPTDNAAVSRPKAARSYPGEEREEQARESDQRLAGLLKEADDSQADVEWGRRRRRRRRRSCGWLCRQGKKAKEKLTKAKDAAKRKAQQVKEKLSKAKAAAKKKAQQIAEKAKKHAEKVKEKLSKAKAAAKRKAAEAKAALEKAGKAAKRKAEQVAEKAKKLKEKLKAAAKKALAAAQKIALKALDALKALGKRMLNSLTKVINSVKTPSGGIHRAISAIGKVVKKSGKMFKDMSKSLTKGKMEERSEYLDEHGTEEEIRKAESVRMAGDLGEGDEEEESKKQCMDIKVPNIRKASFSIKNKDLVKIPDKKLKFCTEKRSPSKILSWFSRTGKHIAIKFLSMLPDQPSINPDDFHYEDEMFYGPSCAGKKTFALQSTVALEAGAAYGVGAAAVSEIGFMVGCMDGGRWQRYFLAPKWGLAAQVTVGFALPAVGISANVYYYAPFTWFRDFGHEVFIGAAVSAVSADIIFGCCVSPMAKGGAPLAFATERKSLKIPLLGKLEFAIPKYPFVRFSQTGGHMAVVVASTGEELGEGQGDDVSVRLFQKSTGRELGYVPGHDGLTLLDPEQRATALEARKREESKRDLGEGEVDSGVLELTINMGYARACRRWKKKTIGRCLSDFNPPGVSPYSLKPRPAPRFCSAGFTESKGATKGPTTIGKRGGGETVKNCALCGAFCTASSACEAYTCRKDRKCYLHSHSIESTWDEESMRDGGMVRALLGESDASLLGETRASSNKNFVSRHSNTNNNFISRSAGTPEEAKAETKVRTAPASDKKSRGSKGWFNSNSGTRSSEKETSSLDSYKAAPRVLPGMIVTMMGYSGHYCNPESGCNKATVGRMETYLVVDTGAGTIGLKAGGCLDKSCSKDYTGPKMMLEDAKNGKVGIAIRHGTVLKTYCTAGDKQTECVSAKTLGVRQQFTINCQKNCGVSKTSSSMGIFKKAEKKAEKVALTKARIPKPSAPPGRYCIKDCNWHCYLDRYADLRKKFGRNVQKAEAHYYNHGKADKRNCRCDGTGVPCRWSRYLQNYPLLAERFVNSEDKEGDAEFHFIKKGKAEGQKCY